MGREKKQGNGSGRSAEPRQVQPEDPSAARPLDHHGPARCQADVAGNSGGRDSLQCTRTCFPPCGVVARSSSPNGCERYPRPRGTFEPSSWPSTPRSLAPSSTALATAWCFLVRRHEARTSPLIADTELTMESRWVRGIAKRVRRNLEPTPKQVCISYLGALTTHLPPDTRDVR